MAQQTPEKWAAQNYDAIRQSEDRFFRWLLEPRVFRSLWGEGGVCQTEWRSNKRDCCNVCVSPHGQWHDWTQTIPHYSNPALALSKLCARTTGLTGGPGLGKGGQTICNNYEASSAFLFSCCLPSTRVPERTEVWAAAGFLNFKIGQGGWILVSCSILWSNYIIPPKKILITDCGVIQLMYQSCIMLTTR